MKTYSVQLQAQEQLAEGTSAFHFTKPAGFEFIAGQALDLILGEQGDADSEWDVRHTFSIVAAPHENELVIATRMRDSRFKQRLKELPVGTQVQVEGPFGELTLDKDLTRAAVFIAGGIGITPFMSMLRDAAQQQRQQDLLLLYSNRRPEDSAFLSELQQLSQNNPRFKLIATMTKMEGSTQEWSGITGYLNAQRIQEYCQELSRPIYYISGPPMLVEAMHDLLDEAGIDEDDVLSEGFLGY